MKIRTDFVTNSSSSSFVIEIEIKLKDGKKYNFQSAYLSPEAGYEPCIMAVSPKQLAQSKDVNELCKMLKHSAYFEDDDVFFDKESAKKPKLRTPPGASKFIKSIEEINSINDIDEISISGEESFYAESDTSFRRYTYNLTTGSYTLMKIGNEDAIEPLIDSAEGRGGDIDFSDEEEAAIMKYEVVPDALIRDAILAKWPEAELSQIAGVLPELPDGVPNISMAISLNGALKAAVLITVEPKSKPVKMLKSICKQANLPIIVINPVGYSAIDKAIKDLKKPLSAEAELDLSVLSQIDTNTPAVDVPQEGNGWSVKVKFADKRAYNYNCFDKVKVGDIVFVEGARIGIPGLVAAILEEKTYEGYYNVVKIIRQ